MTDTGNTRAIEEMCQLPDQRAVYPFKDCVKTVQRHIWKDYEELADDARYTPACQELYRKRKDD